MTTTASLSQQLGPGKTESAIPVMLPYLHLAPGTQESCLGAPQTGHLRNPD